MKVFVSSTVFDLLDTRAELETLLRELGLSPLLSDSATSDFVAQPDRNSIEACLVNVRSSDAVLVILSQRYGPSLAKAGFDDVSATHLEYHEAVKYDRPIYFYVRDRLESDFRINRKNAAGVKLTWVDPKDEKLFDLIEEHQKLMSTASRTNWYMTFRNSVELKQLVRRDLALPAGRASLERAIRESRVPIFEGSVDVVYNTPHPPLCLGHYKFRNLGTVPAYGLTVKWASGADAGGTPIVAPSAAIPLDAQHKAVPFNGNVILEYQTPEGHTISDVFGITIRQGGKGIRLVERRYRVGATAPFTITEP